MIKRENAFVESCKSLIENKNRLAEIRENAIKEAVEKREKFINDYYSLRESREMKEREYGRLMEACRDNAFSTVIKAIYISALEADTLTDDGLLLAESMVDNWIKENGGANKILTERQNNSYLLARIAQIVEEVAIEEVRTIKESESDDGEDDIDDVEEEDSDDDDDDEKEDEVALATKVIEKNIDSDDEEVKKALEVIRQKFGSSDKEDDDDDEKEDTEDKKENESSDDEESKDVEVPDDATTSEDDTVTKDDESDSTEESGEKTGASEDNPLNDTFDDVEDDEESKDVEVPDDATTSEDDTESDTAEDIVDDLEEVPEEDITVDGDTESKGKIFDELEKEEDVKKAVELIHQRVADAEETFIKRNAEDKKQIDELIGRISDNVKTVEDINDEADGKSKVAQEAARLNKQKINQITENRPLTIMEKMTRNLHSNITKDDVIREQYLTEDGNVDTGLIVEAAKVMYGFLETINTLKLEKVDARYIENLLSNM